jgi:hypothetical protein
MHEHSRFAPGSLAVALGLLLLISAVSPDASGVGPLTVTSSEYKLSASFDNVVLADAPADRRLMTELWARVYRPVNLAGAPFPLLVFLHGNHATCGRIAGAGQGHFDINVEYTFSGTCPAGFIVVRSDEGYAYLAQRLASWGYIVVSINANRGVNAAPGYSAPPGSGISVSDQGLNLRRGRLVLRHLEQLYRWNTGVDVTPPSLGFNLAGKLDFSNVGLMGHSRGGEGMRAAYNYYLNPALPARGKDWQAAIPGLTIKAMFEIGPVDGQTGLIMNASGTVWNVLLPMCDGDVFNLQGVRPFDRMLLDFAELPVVQKSTFTVWGTNHNFYNTEWQISDSAGCFANKRLFDHLSGSADQRSMALGAVLALFRGNVGPAADPAFNQHFNPQIELPLSVGDITRVDRGFSDTRNVFDDFLSPFSNSYETSGVTFGFDRVPNHSAQQRAAHVEWIGAGPSTFFQTNWTPPGSGKDVSAYQTLDFRLSRQCGDAPCTKPDQFFNFETNFSIRLVGKNGDLSVPVQLRNYASLTGPVGGLVTGVGSTPHPILETVRIVLTDFGSPSILQNLRGVRFTFDDTKKDEIYIANIRFSANSDLGGAAAVLSALPTADTPLDTGPSTNDTNSVKSMRSVTLASGQSGVDIEFTSNREFLPQGEMLVLRIGNMEFADSRYPVSGETTTVTFTLTAAEFALVSQGDRVFVQYGSGEGASAWSFGRMDKNMLN